MRLSETLKAKIAECKKLCNDNKASIHQRSEAIKRIVTIRDHMLTRLAVSVHNETPEAYNDRYSSASRFHGVPPEEL